MGGGLVVSGFMLGNLICIWLVSYYWVDYRLFMGIVYTGLGDSFGYGVCG